MSRVLLVLGVVCNFALSVSALGQEPGKTWAVGVLSNASSMEEPVLAAFRQRLRELGYIEGHNVRIEFRTAHNQPKQVAPLAEQLVQLKMDAIFVTSTSAAAVLKHATSSIPIVMIGNPVGSDFILDLAHRGGNVTGVSIVSPDLTRKRLQLLKETIPRLARVSVFWNADMPWHAKALEDLKSVAPELSIELRFAPVRSIEELETALATG